MTDSLHGLWTIDFTGPFGGNGSGLVVFQDRKILGGDETYFYVGRYDLLANRLTVDIQVKHYKGLANNIFGPRSQTELFLEAATSSNLIMGQGYEKINPHFRMSFKMQRLAN